MKSANVIFYSLCSIVNVYYYIINDKACVGDGTNIAIEDASYTGSIEIQSSFEDKLITIISNNAFRSCKFSSITIPDTITTIGSYAFFLTSFIEFIFPSQLTELGQYAFGSSSLKVANMSNTKLTTFNGSYVFQHAMIEEVIFPECFTSLPRRSFLGSHLKKFVFPKNLNEMKIGSIGSLGNLEYYESENPNFVVYDGIVYSKDFKTLIAFPHNCTRKIEHTVTTISGIAGFSGYSFSSLVIDLPIKTIEDSAFRNCTNLKLLDLSSTIITSIPLYSFADCPNLTKLILPDTVTYIDAYSFSSSTIENLYLPKSILQVNNTAFKYLSISNIFYCGSNSFTASAPSSSTVHVIGTFPYATLFGRKVIKDYVSCVPIRKPQRTPFPNNCNCITALARYYFQFQIFVAIFILI